MFIHAAVQNTPLQIIQSILQIVGWAELRLHLTNEKVPNSVRNIHVSSRALWKTKLLPVTHVMDTWILTVKPVFKL